MLNSKIKNFFLIIFLSMNRIDRANGNTLSASFAFALNYHGFSVLINNGIMRTNIITLSAGNTTVLVNFVNIGRICRIRGSRKPFATINQKGKNKHKQKNLNDYFFHNLLTELRYKCRLWCKVYNLHIFSDQLRLFRFPE